MRTTVLALMVVAFASACSYSHLGPPAATFNRPATAIGAGSLAVQTGPLVLRINRHVDTIVSGPDNEEDQSLVLQVRDFRLNQRLPIPSDSVVPEFTATRFGPPSKGDTFTGYLIIKKVTPTKVSAYLHLDVTASTPSGSYSQTAKFHGDFIFVERTEELPKP